MEKAAEVDADADREIPKTAIELESAKIDPSPQSNLIVVVKRDISGYIMKDTLSDFKSFTSKAFISVICLQFAISYNVKWDQNVRKKVFWAINTQVGDLCTRRICMCSFDSSPSS